MITTEDGPRAGVSALGDAYRLVYSRAFSLNSSLFSLYSLALSTTDELELVNTA